MAKVEVYNTKVIDEICNVLQEVNKSQNKTFGQIKKEGNRIIGIANDHEARLFKLEKAIKDSKRR